MTRYLPILCLLFLAACAPDRPERGDIAALVDQDNDGLGQLEDCDDTDPQVTTNALVDGCQVGQYCTEDRHCPTGRCDLSAAQPVPGGGRCVSLRCGDGFVLTGVEECDDGNDVDTDDCPTTCEPARCGDGFVQAGVEECDDNNDIDTDSCRNNCTDAICGDGVIQDGVEACDDGNTVTEECAYGLAECTVCAADCTQQPGDTDVCGDGVTDAEEECDDANRVDTDACRNNCEDAGCGDGVIGPNEQCDDGNEYNTDTCSTTCKLLSNQVCAGDCDNGGAEFSTATGIESKLTASDGAAGDWFGGGTGRSVAVSGTTVIVGAIYDENNVGVSGSAYVFERQSVGRWTETVKLTASDGAVGDLFGSSIAISGSIAVIGAFGDDGDVPELHIDDSGSVYVFERQVDGRWTETDKLTSDQWFLGDGGAYGYFGNSVGISDSTVIVGAHGGDDLGNTSGSAYIFDRQADGHWANVARLTASDGAVGDLFGSSVGISGTTAIVGAYRDDDNGYNSGSAYVFELQADGRWTELIKLTASDGSLSDNFGISVGISGTTAIVGAPHDDDNGFGSGSAYVFERQADGRWTELIKLTASDGIANDNFGINVAISDTTAILGASGNDDSGSAYIFERQADGRWTELIKLTASDGIEGDNFGISVAISDTTAIVGAPYDDDNGVSSGSAYVFEAGPQCYAEGDDAGACFCKEGAAGVLCDERPLCGDELVQDAEQCDDGNQDDGDGCDGLCSVE